MEILHRGICKDVALVTLICEEVGKSSICHELCELLVESSFVHEGDCRRGAGDLWGSAAPLLVRPGVAINVESKHNEEHTILPRFGPPGGVKPYSCLWVYWWCLSTNTQSAHPRQVMEREQLQEYLCVRVAKIQTPANVSLALLL